MRGLGGQGCGLGGPNKGAMCSPAVGLGHRPRPWVVCWLASVLLWLPRLFGIASGIGVSPMMRGERPMVLPLGLNVTELSPNFGDMNNIGEQVGPHAPEDV